MFRQHISFFKYELNIFGTGTRMFTWVLDTDTFISIKQKTPIPEGLINCAAGEER